MSKTIASAAIRGAHKIVNRAEDNLNKALEGFGADKKVEFPNTGFFLPVIYAMTATKVEKLSDLQTVLGYCKDLLPPKPTDNVWLPYLGNALDAGMATLFADEIIESIKYLDGNILM